MFSFNQSTTDSNRKARDSIFRINRNTRTAEWYEKINNFQGVIDGISIRDLKLLETHQKVLAYKALPMDVREVLEKGPEYSQEPTIMAHALLFLHRRVPGMAPLEDHERCLLYGVERLTSTTKNMSTMGLWLSK